MQVKVIMDVVISIRHRKNLAIFFVWKREIEHKEYITCKCGQLCKKINISKKGLLPVFKFVCINNMNKYNQRCNIFLDA